MARTSRLGMGSAPFLILIPVCLFLLLTDRSLLSSTGTLRLDTSSVFPQSRNVSSSLLSSSNTTGLTDLTDRSNEADWYGLTFVDRTSFVSEFQGSVAEIGSGKQESRSIFAPEDEMAACLLVKDDNHFLIEWLAYHYHVLPLRHLIIATDPYSLTSPDEILDRWRKKGMAITKWAHPSEYMTSQETRAAVAHVRASFRKENPPEEVIQHRARQRVFYYKCMKQHKENGRHWTMLTDTDEYLFLNRKTMSAFKVDGPPITEEGSVANFLKQEMAKPSHNFTNPCVSIPRSRVGSVESARDEVDRQVPFGFNASAFQTLRWRKHANADNYATNKIAKALMDLSRVDTLLMVTSIHRPVKSLCSFRDLHIRSHQTPLLLNHYIGTAGQFFYRDDPRNKEERSEDSYSKLSSIDQETDDMVRPWLSGFVDEHGEKAAKSLLSGVGALVPVENNHSATENK